MSSDFELKRLNEKIKKLQEEQTLTNQMILRTRRDEQMELDYVRRRFNSLIQNLEDKQRKNLKDMATYERQLENLERRIEDDREEAKKELENSSGYGSRRYTR